MHFRFTLCLLLLTTALRLSGQTPDATPPTATPVAPAPIGIPDDGVRVAILGYHDFSPTLPETEMRINTKKFRDQMQFLKDQGLTVISMADFTAWKRGEKPIPARSVVITIDDGWNSVYTDAYPILKEFRYPFTLFLYTNYVDVQGRSLSSSMIKEMQKNGATIGNHSMSHPYPAAVKSQQRSGPKTYEKFLDREMAQSKNILEKNFGQKINTFCYPGGFHTEEMFEVAKKLNYEHLFTVLPGKIKRSSDDHTLPRYVILGTHDRIFELATEFRDAASPSIATAPKQNVPYPVMPDPGSIINSRLPLITIDLSTVTDIEPTSLVMRVGGFGDVPAIWDPNTKQLQWQVNRRLRDDVCQVSVSWKGLDKKTAATPVRWNFLIDKEAAYQPNGG
jgi:peptidoglycan/xylan/chitin deacetylase (PgdA/CDA1 family)